MASEKQMKYIEKLCNWKGVEFMRDKCSALADEDASAYIDDLKSMKSVSSRNTQPVVHMTSRPKPASRGDLNSYSVPEKADQFNPVQMGMVKKAVMGLTRTALYYWIEHPDRFVKCCKDLYWLCEAADDVVKASYKEVSQ